MPSASVNRVVWVVMFGVLAALAYQTRENLELYFAGVGRLEERVAPDQDTLFLSWRGRIDAPMASRIADAFARHRNEAQRVVLSLSSPGGSLDQGAEVIRLLRRIRETHRLDTVIEARRMCASMCVPVYLQGEQRMAAANARFMFHEVRFQEFGSDAELDVPEQATGAATDRLFERYFLTAGVSQNWVDEVRAEMSGGHDVWRTARQLVDQQSGIVRQII